VRKRATGERIGRFGRQQDWCRAHHRTPTDENPRTRVRMPPQQ
jgi:hypothetical protein